jgi:transcriptional regulator with XRE-family HTH domain
LGDRLAKARRGAGLTQLALANKVGVSVAIIGKLEQGINASSTRLVDIALACSVDPTWLSRGRAAPRPRTHGDFSRELQEALATVEHLAGHPDAAGRAARLVRAAVTALANARKAAPAPRGAGRPPKAAAGKKRGKA